MPRSIINLFMWGYQEHYRTSIQDLAREVLRELGAFVEAEVLLVGARKPGSKNPNPVCVEPENGKWPLSLFDGLLEAVERAYSDHELQTVFYGDEASMRDKPMWMRRSSVRRSVESRLTVFDKENDVASFCGEVRSIGDYYVAPVIQIPNSIFSQFRPLPSRPEELGQLGERYRSLIHAAIMTVLYEATELLEKPDPGRSIFSKMRTAREIVRKAASNFMHTPGLSIERQYTHTDLFDALNIVSSLMYEGAIGIGQLILVNPDNGSVEFMVKFKEPVRFREPRWSRKILQMAAEGVGVIADSRCIYGLGRLKNTHDPDAQDAFVVTFIDHYHWVLHCGDQELLRSQYGVPKLPKEPVDKATFLSNYNRMFPIASQENGLHIWGLMLTQIDQPHGSMIVIAEDAHSEAKRLSQQGTLIEPILLSEALLSSVSGIDGTILLDPSGICYAIGIILDGEATDQCTPSRGSRYNSGVRYVRASKSRRFAIVISDDRTIDIIPKLRPLVSLSKIEQYIAHFEAANRANYHEARNWLNKHRFYLDSEQCCRINKAIERLDALPSEVGSIYIPTERFEPHLDFEKSYLVD
ncbi:MAG: hypothetical protein JJ879_16130 [Sneathiella sp.]|nr:hypothetical protein [Sneathiella sp.]